MVYICNLYTNFIAMGIDFTQNQEIKYIASIRTQAALYQLSISVHWRSRAALREKCSLAPPYLIEGPGLTERLDVAL
jgi:hypothetical protein